MARLSLAEKIGQLVQVGGLPFLPGPKPEEIIRQGGAGSVLWLNDTARLNALQKIAVEESSPKILPAPLGHWSTSAGTWVQDAEAFDICVGADASATLHADLAVVRQEERE